LNSVSAISIPREEGAEGERQASVFGEPRQAERHEQQVEDEELLAPALDDDREPPAHHDLSAGEQHDQQDPGLQRSQCEFAEQGLR
jgi:hypothetical protein